MHVRVDELSGAERVLLYGLALERLRALRVPLSARDLVARQPPPPALCAAHTSQVRTSRFFLFFSFTQRTNLLTAIAALNMYLILMCTSVRKLLRCETYCMRAEKRSAHRVG